MLYHKEESYYDSPNLEVSNLVLLSLVPTSVLLFPLCAISVAALY